MEDMQTEIVDVLCYRPNSLLFRVIDDDDAFENLGQMIEYASDFLVRLQQCRKAYLKGMQRCMSLDEEVEHDG